RRVAKRSSHDAIAGITGNGRLEAVIPGSWNAVDGFGARSQHWAGFVAGSAPRPLYLATGGQSHRCRLAVGILLILENVSLGIGELDSAGKAHGASFFSTRLSCVDTRTGLQRNVDVGDVN